MEYRIFTLDAHTWRIEECDAVTSTYMYLLEGNKEAMLIDTGVGIIDVREVVRSLTLLPVSVLNTHGHFDHVGGNSLFDVVYMHEADKELYQMQCGEFRQRYFPQYSYRKMKDTIKWIKDGAVFDLGGRTLEVIHAPGHSVGSICILDVEHQWLFTGDTCCKADVLLNLDYSTTVEEYADTIRHLQKYRPRFVTTWPGHHSVPVEPEQGSVL